MIDWAIATLPMEGDGDFRRKLAESGSPPDTSNMSDEIKYSTESGIGVLMINRPAARNALNWTAQEQFAEVLKSVAADPGLRILIITGAGEQAFASGGDLKELARSQDKADGRRLIQIMSQALEQLTNLPIPVIAAINGDSVGGRCEILTACDLRISTIEARFRFAQAAVGLTTGWGGAGRLIQLLGQSRASGVLLTARVFGAQEAKDIGFLHEIVPMSEDVLLYAKRLARELASLPRQSLANTKKLLWSASDYSSRDLKLLEEDLFIELWSRDDRREAMLAFLEKRKPQPGTL